jgi:hypothetical protein
MKKSVNQYQQLNQAYLARLDTYDILNDTELNWLLSSNVQEERIIASLLLRDRKAGTLTVVSEPQKN